MANAAFATLTDHGNPVCRIYFLVGNGYTDSAENGGKQMRKYIAIACCMLLLLSGCSSAYERDTQPGEVVTTGIDELEQMMADGEDFAVIFTQSWCTHCQALLTMLDDYLKDHHVIVYDVVIDADPEYTAADAAKKVMAMFEDLENTPTAFYVVDGKPGNILESGEDGMSEEMFDNWVQHHKIDAKAGS